MCILAFSVISKIFLNIKLTEGLIVERDSGRKVSGTLSERCRPRLMAVMVVVMVT